MKIVAVLTIFLLQTCLGKYTPDWPSIDTRPLPSWYDEAKVGIFIHWGVFAVPSYGQGFASEWFWWNWKGVASPSAVYYMEQNYPPNFQYADFAPDFTAEFFDPSHWADVFKASGAKYVVLTSKHHEGFTNWPSANSWNWNSMDVGPKRDLVGELATAIRNRTSIHFGLYHSLFEWFHPLYLQDKANKFNTQDFVNDKTMPELYDIVNKYHPEVIWSDGQWEANSTYWKSAEFIAWLYNSSPVKDTVVTNDRWGSDTLCKHGGYLTCQDHFDPGVLQPRKWENCITIDTGSWGFRRNADLNQYRAITDILQELVTTISCNGNYLINIGPTREGMIAPIFEERLRQMGTWLGINGEAVYKSKPWSHQNDTVTPNVWYTSSDAAQPVVYAFLFKWASSVNLGAPVPIKSTATVDLLGGASGLQWASVKSSGITVTLPTSTDLQWLWVLRLTGFTGK